MLANLEMLRTVHQMQENGVALENTKRYPPAVLLDFCYRIKELEPGIRQGINLMPRLQQEIIQNPDFLEFYQQLIHGGLTNSIVESWLKTADEFNEPLTDYPATILIDAGRQFTVADSTKTETRYGVPTPGIYYDTKLRHEYVKYLLPLIKSDEEKEIVLKNLNEFVGQKTIRVSQLTNQEHQLFLKPYFTDCLDMYDENLGAMLRAVASHKEIQDLLIFLSDKQVGFQFSSEEIWRLLKLNCDLTESFRKIFCVLEENIEDMLQFLLRWFEDEAPADELERFSQRTEPIPAKERELIFSTRIGYLNYLYSNMLDGSIPFSRIDEYQQEVIVYAISHKKQSFLKMVSKNIDVFLELGAYSMIFDPEFYHRCNLNTLSVKDLKNSEPQIAHDSHLHWLEEKEYTFEELRTLRYAGRQYYVLYKNLQLPRVDDRLKVIRQMLKHDIVPCNLPEPLINNIAKRLSEKPFDRWRDQEFSHLRGIGRVELVRCLAVYEDVKRFLPDLRHWEEAVYIARNHENLKECSCWQEAIENLLEHDSDWQTLRMKLDLNDQFIQEYRDSIVNFLVRDGAEMSRIYYDRTDSKESFKRIVLSELMGQFRTLKYYKDDLKKEISYSIEYGQTLVWMTDTSKVVDNLEVYEAADFYSTLRLGEKPQHTCLSYINGSHSECILSTYDSNKKIVFAKLNGVLVGRAIMRLTKGSFYSPQKATANKEPALEFVDFLQSSKEPEKQVIKPRELLTLFLERPYIKGIPEKDKIKVLRMFAALVSEKAKELNAIEVLNTNYAKGMDKKDYVQTGYYLYISKSKGGKQYLDSLSGEVTISDEGSYRRGLFFIKQKNIGAVA